MDTTEDFNPYRQDGKLVNPSFSPGPRPRGPWHADPTSRSYQYGFVCVVSGASQPVGQAIIRELAGMAPCPCYPLSGAAAAHEGYDYGQLTARHRYTVRDIHVRASCRRPDARESSKQLVLTRTSV